MSASVDVPALKVKIELDQRETQLMMDCIEDRAKVLFKTVLDDHDPIGCKQALDELKEIRTISDEIHRQAECIKEILAEP